jgi:hypothetical protein
LVFKSQSYYQGSSYVHEFLVDKITVFLSSFDKLPSYIYYAFSWSCAWFIMYIFEQDQCFFFQVDNLDTIKVGNILDVMINLLQRRFFLRFWKVWKRINYTKNIFLRRQKMGFFKCVDVEGEVYMHNLHLSFVVLCTTSDNQLF